MDNLPETTTAMDNLPETSTAMDNLPETTTATDNVYESSTTINDLPEELFGDIFNRLTHDDILSCSKVCVYWKNLIEEQLGDSFWMKLCAREYPDIHKDGRRTSNLSWRQLCHSVYSWADVNQLKKSSSIQPMPHGQIGTVHLLKNNIICYPIRRLKPDRPGEEIYETSYYAVVYFDVKKREIVDTREFGVNFLNFRESDDIIVIEVFEQTQHMLRVFSKRFSNEMTEQFIFHFMEECSWFVIKNDVYYQTKARDDEVTLHRLRVIEKNGKVRFENIALAESFSHEILAIEPSGDTVHLLRRIFNHWMYVAAIEDHKMKPLFCYFKLTRRTAIQVFRKFQRFGFYLSNPDFNRKIFTIAYLRKIVIFRIGSKLEASVPYGPYTISFTCQDHWLHPKPWKLKIAICMRHEDTPPQRLEFEIESIAFPIKEIELVQIIESANGHIIIIGYYGYKQSIKDRRLILLYIDT